MKTKNCTKCKITKNLSEFYIRSGGRPHSHCKKCMLTSFEERRRADPERVRAVGRKAGRKYSLKKRYGLSVEAYEEMYEAQGGKCAICDDPFPVLHVDHNHRSGQLRGLLCGSCNRALGLLADSVDRLVAAADYVRKYDG